MKKKSQHGMSYLRRDFSSQQLCRIIEACSRSGVSSLTLGELKLEFSNGLLTVQGSQPASVQAEQITNDSEKNKLEAIIEAQARRLEDLRKKEELEMNLPLLDPVAWEEMEINRDWEVDINAENS